MKITSVLITGLLVGAAGAIAATLFAPDKGTKTRSKIAGKGQEYKDYLMDSYSDLVNSVFHPFETMEEETRRLSEKAKANAKKVKAEVS